MLVNFYPESFTLINLFNLFFSLKTFGCELEIFFIMDFEPININSVLATLRLSLLAINHFLRFSKSGAQMKKSFLFGTFVFGLWDKIWANL